MYLIYLAINILGHIFDLLDHLWMEERTSCGLRWIQTAWYTYSTIYLIYLFMYIVRTWPYIWFTWQTLDGGEDNLWSPRDPDRLIIVTSRSVWGQLQLIHLFNVLSKRFSDSSSNECKSSGALGCCGPDIFSVSRTKIVRPTRQR